ncbi:MAG: hypothetical protein ISS45_06410 [Candidatus Omnitrophica bacterium]|nr:hypothetical protein [Candidatus Omnitrophota bacterium]
MDDLKKKIWFFVIKTVELSRFIPMAAKSSLDMKWSWKFFLKQTSEL